MSPRPACSLLALFLTEDMPMIEQQGFVQPEQLNFKDDGVFPNSVPALLCYRQAIATEGRS
jgi:hypothetical protein